MKVCFSGSHGVGKSTASYYLTSLLKQKNPGKSVICLEENVRNIAQLTGGDLKNEDFPYLAITNQLFREFQAERLYDIVITDRSTLDFFAYSKFTEFTITETYKNLAINHMHSFNRIYFIRPDNEKSKIVDDGFRDIDKTFRNKIDEQFAELFHFNCFTMKEIKTAEILTYDYLKDLNVRIY